MDLVKHRGKILTCNCQHMATNPEAVYKLDGVRRAVDRLYIAAPEEGPSDLGKVTTRELFGTVTYKSLFMLGQRVVSVLLQLSIV